MEGVKTIIARYQNVIDQWNDEIIDLEVEGEGSYNRLIKLKAKVDILNRILNDLKAL